MIPITGRASSFLEFLQFSKKKKKKKWGRRWGVGDKTTYITYQFTQGYNILHLLQVHHLNLTFISVVGAYVVRASSLNYKHSSQLFRLSSRDNTAPTPTCIIPNLSCLLATTFSSLRFLSNSLSSPRFNLVRGAVSRGFPFSYFRVLSSAFLPSVLWYLMPISHDICLYVLWYPKMIK